MNPYHARVLDMLDDQPRRYTERVARDGYELVITDADTYIEQQTRRAKRLLRNIANRKHSELTR